VIRHEIPKVPQNAPKNRHTNAVEYLGVFWIDKTLLHHYGYPKLIEKRRHARSFGFESHFLSSKSAKISEKHSKNALKKYL